MGITEEEIDTIPSHDDDYNEDFAFIQPRSTHPMVSEARTLLSKGKMYLDTTSTFHQICHEELLDSGAHKVSTKLRAHCNAGTTYSDEQGRLLGLFDVWLVRNGIANILSVPQLERDGFEPEYV